MKSKFFKLIAVIAVAVVVALLLKNIPGTIMIYTGDERRVISLAVFISALIILFVVLYLLCRLLVGLLNLPSRFRRWRQLKNTEYENLLLTQSLKEVFLKNEDKGLRKLFSKGRTKERQALASLAIAKQAQYVANVEKRDHYWQQAVDYDPSLKPVAYQMKILWLLDEGNAEQANVLMQELQNNPAIKRDVRFERYQLRVLNSIKRDSSEYTELLRSMLNKKHISVEEGRQLLDENLSLRLRNVYADDGFIPLWNSLSHAEKTMPSVALVAAKYFTEHDQESKATDILARSLDVKMDKTLLTKFVHCSNQALKSRMKLVQSWLKAHPDHTDLLKAAARLCMASGLWGQAEHYIQDSLKVLPKDAESYFILGSMYDKLGKADEALTQWRIASELSTASPDVLMEQYVLQAADKTRDPSGQPDEKLQKYADEHLLKSDKS
ncbi:heme biosynthesis HemY N-terminal domain-containing protein [Basilea psittacipulmonis]|uniref:HemY N-terminal domain-containing protein n=1 Tax=Basilea psittacipulmonis DSM 24701 TaxID=1072685 RepID=A0A077DD48_9BURK|nr:heme biosynthesis HemY N-terminal domain-containing protein [Basilea psittacipulmonis]AIL32755.1 hypothetical protein IX83_05030 [Basilea psittacipulmonis DSM 24701]